MIHYKLAKVLERLQGDSITFAEELRSRRDPHNIYDHDKGTNDVQGFYLKIKQEEDILGRARTIRILRHQTLALRGLDKNKNEEAILEPNIRWVEAVLLNIEHELEVIDRKRTLFLTVASVIAATAAAIAATVALFKM